MCKHNASVFTNVKSHIYKAVLMPIKVVRMHNSVTMNVKYKELLSYGDWCTRKSKTSPLRIGGTKSKETTTVCLYIGSYNSQSCPEFANEEAYLQMLGCYSCI